MKIEQIPLEHPALRSKCQGSSRWTGGQGCPDYHRVPMGQPIVVDEDMVIIKGHGRYLAAKEMGQSIPVVVADNPSPTQVRTARLADKVAGFQWEKLIAEMVVTAKEIAGFWKSDQELIITWRRSPLKSAEMKRKSWSRLKHPHRTVYSGQGTCRKYFKLIRMGMTQLTHLRPAISRPWVDRGYQNLRWARARQSH